MSPDLRTIKRIAAGLSAQELNYLVGWCYRQAEKKEREAQSDSSQGIQPKSLLQAFRRVVPTSGNRVTLVFASLAATALIKFYQEVRVRGCRFEYDADMLLVEWGLDGKEPFLSFTRQILPDTKKGQVWQLKMHYYYHASDAPKGFRAGSRWCHSLKEIDAFTAFICTSRFISHLGKRPHADTSLTYEAVE